MYFREQNGAFTLDPGGPLDRPVPPRQPARPRLVRRPPAVRRDLLPEPADLPRRRAPTARAFATLDRLLVEGGLLFLGHADRAGRSGATPFVPAGDKGSFCYRKGKAGPQPVCPPLPPGEGRGQGSSLPPPPLPGRAGVGGRMVIASRKSASSESRRVVRAPAPQPSPQGEGAREDERCWSCGAPHPRPLSRREREEEKTTPTSADSSGLDPRSRFLAGGPRAIRRGDPAGRAGRLRGRGDGPSVLPAGPDPPGGGGPRAGRGPFPQGRLSRRPA